jgi:peptidoglycan/LPS O-acetylase OafA/YrhL
VNADRTADADISREAVPDRLRGVAALMVALYHCILPFYDQLTASLPSWLLHPLFAMLNGGAGVALFFVLSGYVLTLSLNRMRRDVGIAPRFLLRRLFRILPAWWLSVLFCIALYALLTQAGLAVPAFYTANLHAGHGVALILRHAWLADISLNPVGWTLQVEVLAAPLMLIIWAVGARHALLNLVPIGGLIGWLYRDLLNPVVPGVYLAQFAFMFAIGSTHDRVSSWLTRRFPRRHQALLRLGFVLGLAAWLIPASHALLKFEPGYYLASGIGAFMVLLGARHLPSASRRVQCVLSYCGKVSYSFYLLHTPLLLSTFALLAWVMPGIEAHTGWYALLAACLSVPLALWLAGPMFRIVEQTSIALGRRFEQRILPPSGAPARSRLQTAASTVQENATP